MYSIVILSILGILVENGGASVNVTTEQGVLSGLQLLTVTGKTLYNSFKGIPYAKPPVGTLRFQPPQSAESWEGVRDASKHGSICPQYNWATKTFVLGSEDCLFLNVYSPSSIATALPVLFFIHGGGFSYGSGNSDYYGPDFLLDQNVVVVTTNFRQDTLGFLCLDTPEIAGNMGLKDLVAALKWVQSNIKNFGGDPDQVTIFGEGGGGVACTLLATSPMAAGLFKRVIAMNGVSDSEYGVAFEQPRRALLLSKSLGFESENTTEIFEFLQSVPFNVLINPNSSIIVPETTMDFVAKVYPTAVVEKDCGQERFLTEAPEVSILNGRVNTADFMFGFASNIAISAISSFETPTYYMMVNYNRYPENLVTRSLYYDVTPRNLLKLSDQIKEYYFGSKPMNLTSMPEFINYFTDIYIYPIIRLANHLVNASQNVNLFQFSYVAERNVLNKEAEKYNITGCAHTDDLNYIFNATRITAPLDLSGPSYAKIVQMCTLITNFAKYGNTTDNSTLGIDWPLYDLVSQTYLDIGENLTLNTCPRKDMMGFWEGIFYQAGIEF